jgi:hypothetical protein
MNKFLAIILLLTLDSCLSTKSSNKQATELPSPFEIFDVISSVIKIDSLDYNHSIEKLLLPVKVYPIPYWPNDNTPPPPPPPGGFYYHHLLEILNSKNHIERQNDSTFISLQSKRSKEILIVDSLTKKFEIGSDHVYQFKVPIFSSDKKRVYFEYWDNCGPLCGVCYGDLLYWTDSIWTRVEQFHCGIR